MKKSISKNLTKRKRKISKRLKKRNWEDQVRPMLKTTNIHYEMDGRHQGIAQGGIENFFVVIYRSCNQLSAVRQRLKVFVRPTISPKTSAS